MGADRLADQVRFLLEIDRLKQVDRQCAITGGERRENAAEHSWHLAVMAAVLAEHAAEPVDVGHVVRLLLVHDLVEIDAGDTFVYDEAGAADKAEREARCADRLFALLPPDQAAELRALWEEFEERATPDARFAAAVDRLQPVLLNHATGGEAWRRHGVTAEQVLRVNAGVGDASPALGDLVARLVEDAVGRGLLPPAPG